MKTRGFTLIELLVVIAIIGILSSVVLASLNQARSKGKDAAAKAALSQVRAQAELFADDNGSDGYLGACGDAERILQNAIDNSSDADALPADVCADDEVSWAAAVILASDETTSFCVDASGASGEDLEVGVDGNNHPICVAQ